MPTTETKLTLPRAKSLVDAVRLPWHTVTVEQSGHDLCITVEADRDTSAANGTSRSALFACCDAIGYGQAALGQDVTHSQGFASVWIRGVV